MAPHACALFGRHLIKAHKLTYDFSTTMGNEFGKDGEVTKFCEGLPVVGTHLCNHELQSCTFFSLSKPSMCQQKFGPYVIYYTFLGRKQSSLSVLWFLISRCLDSDSHSHGPKQQVVITLSQCISHSTVYCVYGNCFAVD